METQKGISDLTEQIMAFEQGEMEDEQVIELFQRLIDNGMAWSLQGAYGRMAQHLIEQGYCHPKKR